MEMPFLNSTSIDPLNLPDSCLAKGKILIKRNETATNLQHTGFTTADLVVGLHFEDLFLQEAVIFSDPIFDLLPGTDNLH